MAADRFVYWNERRPSKEELEKALTDYMGDGIGCVKWQEDRWYVTINGRPSHPLNQLEPDSGLVVALRESEGRWFEVVWDDDCIDVLTRQQDPITSSIAEGFYNFCMRYWQGQATERGLNCP